MDEALPERRDSRQGKRRGSLHDVELMYVGYGWYLEEIKKFYEGDNSVHFAGEQGGETLASLYADSDFFLFPSVTDTFGNVVVEAMSTGTPALVSDYGGPHDIVMDDAAGRILPIDEEAWLKAMEECRKLFLEEPGQNDNCGKHPFPKHHNTKIKKTIPCGIALYR